MLLGDQLVARFDLKADRLNRRLLVRASHIEAGADEEHTARHAIAEIRTWARWLNLATVQIGRKGQFSTALRRAAVIA